MEKVKLTREQAEAFKGFKAGNFKLIDFIESREYWSNAFEPLKDIAVDKFARMLYEPDSYEVDEEYKVGGWVVDVATGKVHEVAEIKGKAIITPTGLKIGFSWLRHATSEEIKAEQERRVWAKIGREVGEFRVGDIRVLKGTVSGFVRTNCVRNARDEYQDGQLKGFYPAESFISFGGGEE